MWNTVAPTGTCVHMDPTGMYIHMEYTWIHEATHTYLNNKCIHA